ncbi:MAG TPA: hypothetical protein VNE42_01155 [Acidimicrobiales bacterium]|nr:hypothetical protein [Acidimicrobiales bacterium]
MGLPGMVISGISAAVGAIMYWAVTARSSNVVQNHGFRLSTVGVILMIAGAVGFVASAVVFATSRKAPAAPPRTLTLETVDDAGDTSSVHEKQNY